MKKLVILLTMVSLFLASACSSTIKTSCRVDTNKITDQIQFEKDHQGCVEQAKSMINKSKVEGLAKSIVFLTLPYGGLAYASSYVQDMSFDSKRSQVYGQCMAVNGYEVQWEVKP